MAQERKLTTIDLPHKCLERVGGILEDAGFTLGTVGGGYAEMEREGEITETEKQRLIREMAACVFQFETSDIEDDDASEE